MQEYVCISCIDRKDKALRGQKFKIQKQRKVRKLSLLVFLHKPAFPDHMQQFRALVIGRGRDRTITMSRLLLRGAVLCCAVA